MKCAKPSSSAASALIPAEMICHSCVIKQAVDSLPCYSSDCPHAHKYVPACQDVCVPLPSASIPNAARAADIACASVPPKVHDAALRRRLLRTQRRQHVC